MKTKSLLLISSFCVLFLVSCEGQKSSKGQDVKMKNTADSAGYAIGTMIGQNLKKDGLDSINVELLAAGIKAVLHKDSVLIKAQDAQQIVQGYVGSVKAKQGDEQKKVGQKFLDENKGKPGVVTTASGLQYQIIKAGTGPKPLATDTVSTNYTGTLIDGTVFDSSERTGKPVSFPVGGVIKGWTEALLMMPKGSKWKLFIPSDLAYGDRGAGGQIGPNATLIFDIELVAINGK
ncbi:MAG: FKBP-type peptidyl-prolyl cis-trans isomerase [Bacteroidota bacterium]